MNNSKTFHRGSVLTAFCLAVLFALQAVCALLPACIVRAASSDSVEIWDEDKKVDYGYRFSMKFQPILLYICLSSRYNTSMESSPYISSILFFSIP